MQTENAVIQISTLEHQKNNSKPNVSTIDLGESENILRNKFIKFFMILFVLKWYKEFNNKKNKI